MKLKLSKGSFPNTIKHGDLIFMVSLYQENLGKIHNSYAN